jgi:hypothetical protein
MLSGNLTFIYLEDSSLHDNLNQYDFSASGASQVCCEAPEAEKSYWFRSSCKPLSTRYMEDRLPDNIPVRLLKLRSHTGLDHRANCYPPDI